MRRELQIRMAHYGAFMLYGEYRCAVHPKVELNDDGSCDQCHITESIIADDILERRAMNRAARIQEHDL